MRRASRRGRLARVLAASALARLAAAYETVVRDGALVPGPPADGPTWTAAVATPALAAHLDANADAVPGALALAPGGALRVTRATRANTPDPDPDVAAVLVLGARAPRDGQEPVHLALDVRASPLDPDDASPPAWTSCDLTLDHLGAWRASTASPLRAEDDARDDPVDPPREPSAATAACTVTPLAPRDEDESIPNLPPVDGGDGTDPSDDSYSAASASVLVRARVEVSLQVSPVPSAANPNANPNANANDAFAVDSRVDVVALASPSTRDAIVVAVDGLAIVRASDLVELAWAWVSRAARCAAELYGAVVSSCGGGGGGGGVGGASDAFDRVGAAAALVGGCCAAVASYANAGCDCATRVVPTETLLVGETLAAARDASAMRAAARSLAELCGANERDEGVDREDDDESGCVAESATLAAVRAFVARDAAANAPNVDVFETRANAGETARDPVVVAAASRSQSESESESRSDDAYGAFLEWLGREDEPTVSATPPPSELERRNVAAPPSRPPTAQTVSSPPRFPTTAPPAVAVSARGAPPAVAAFAAAAPNAENTDAPKNAPDARRGRGAWSNGWEAGAAAGAGVASLACVAFAAFAARRWWRRRWWPSSSSSNEGARRATRLVRSDVEGAVLVARRVVPGKAPRAGDQR